MDVGKRKKASGNICDVLNNLKIHILVRVQQQKKILWY